MDSSLRRFLGSVLILGSVVLAFVALPDFLVGARLVQADVGDPRHPGHLMGYPVDWVLLTCGYVGVPGLLASGIYLYRKRSGDS